MHYIKPSDKDIIPESAFAYEESRKEFDKIKEIEKHVDREKSIYKTFKHTYDFREFKKIRTFGESIYNGKITLEEADESQSDLLGEIKNFNDKTRPQTFKKKQMKEHTLSTLKMDTIFMNSENSKTSEPHILKLKLTDKLDLRLDKKVIALSNLSIYYTWNNIKSS